MTICKQLRSDGEQLGTDQKQLKTSVLAAAANFRLKPEPELATIPAELSCRLLSCHFS